MPKAITFKAATKGGGSVEKTGFKVWLKVGQTRHAFVLQHDFDRPSILTDYRTGYKLASLAGMALARYVSNPYAWAGGLPGFRMLAQEWLDNLVVEKGETAIIEKLAGPATLNA